MTNVTEVAVVSVSRDSCSLSFQGQLRSVVSPAAVPVAVSLQ